MRPSNFRSPTTQVNKSQKNPKNQIKLFHETARELGCDDAKERLEKRPEKIEVDCTPWLRHENQGQLSVIEIEGGDIAAFNLGNNSSYSAGGR
jgi:hypothetical protein